MVYPSAIDRVIEGLMAYDPEKIILFGSAARGDTDEYSDIDLILIKQTDKRFVQRLVEAGSLIPLDLAVDVFVYTPEEFQSMIEKGNPFIEEALKDGKLVYEKTAGGKGRQAAVAWQHPVRKGRAFVKKSLESARRWLAQAQRGLTTVAALLQNSLWAEACFHAEQTAQLALKAFLFGRGRRHITIHSVRELAQQCASEDSDFSRFVGYGTFLDRYYLATRYPDALPEPAVPFESFTEQEARQALAFATEMVELVRAKVPAASPEPGA